MKKSIGLIAVLSLYVCSTLFVQGIAFPGGQAPEWLPTQGLATSGVDTQGRTIYHLPYFGDFVFDKNNSERIIQLGPIGAFTWDYDEERKYVTLNTDWWGPLHTSAQGSDSDIGVTFPDVISELQGGSNNRAFYRFDVHNKDVVFGRSVFDYRRKIWTSAVGAAKYDAKSFYNAAEAAFIQIQNITQSLRNIKNNLTVTQVGEDSQSTVDEFRIRAEAQEERLNTFKNYYFHYHNRLLDSQNWLRATGAFSHQVRTLQQTWILGGLGGSERHSLAQLQSKVLATFEQGMVAANQFNVVYDTKNNQIQSIINKPATPPSNGGEEPSGETGDPGSGGGSSEGGAPTAPPGGNAFVVYGDDYSAPPGAYNVKNDAISWNDVIFTGKPGEGYQRSTVATWNVDVTLHGVDIGLQPDFVPPHHLEWMIQGNIDTNGQTWGGAWWILVPYQGKWYAAPFEGFDLSVAWIWYGLGNLNWPTDNADMYDSHTRVLRGSSLDKNNTAVWGTEWGTPKRGETYGFFLSSDLDERKGRHRSNIVLKTFP